MNDAHAAKSRTGSKIHVVHAVLSLDRGGLEQLVLQMCESGPRRNIMHSIVCIERRGALAPAVEALGVEVCDQEKGKGLRLVSTHRKLRETLRRLKPDVVHSHQAGALFHAGAAAWREGIPVVHTEHGKHYQTAKSRWLGWIAGRLTSHFVCVSQDIADDLIERGIVAAARVKVVRNGINVQRFYAASRDSTVRDELNIGEDEFVIGTVGRVSKVKRQDVLVRAFAELCSRRSDVHLVIVGDGPERNTLEQLASELKLDGRIHFTGFRDDRERFLGAMDVFALTSESEGMPLVILEAWSAGLPVVSSEVGGVPEIVEHNKTGLLFPHEDITKLADILTDLVENETRRRELSKAGRNKVVQEYEFDVMLEQYEQIYRQACGVSA